MLNPDCLQVWAVNLEIKSEENTYETSFPPTKLATCLFSLSLISATI